MFKKVTLLIVDLLALLCCLQANLVAAEDGLQSVDIVLKSKASIATQRIYLSDVASCSQHKTYCQEASGIDLGPSPLPGRTSFLQKSQVEALLGKDWPGISINLSGPEMIRIETLVVEVPAEDLRLKLEDLISSKLRTHKDIRARVVRLQPLNQVKVRPSQTRIDFTEVKNMIFDDRTWFFRNFLGNKTVQVRMSNPSDAEDFTVVSTNVFISIEVQVPAPVHAIGVSQIISSDDIKLSWITLRSGYRDIIFDSNAIVGKKARQTLAGGEPIAARFLANVFAVQRNQPVQLIMKNEGLEISAQAISQQSGSIGQTIEVLNVATKRKLRARIVSDQKVEAVFF
jgi:flagella basal body P-ring formation protein FlgA